MKKVLVINAHQFYEGFASGKLNQKMAGVIKEEMAQRGYQVMETTIQDGYDIAAEVQKHVDADLIMLQTPVYWFGTPWIYKKYVDEVFTAGLVQQSLLTDDGRTRDDPSKQYGSDSMYFLPCIFPPLPSATLGNRCSTAKPSMMSSSPTPPTTSSAAPRSCPPSPVMTWSSKPMSREMSRGCASTSPSWGSTTISDTQAQGMALIAKRASSPR